MLWGSHSLPPASAALSRPPFPPLSPADWAPAEISSDGSLMPHHFAGSGGYGVQGFASGCSVDSGPLRGAESGGGRRIPFQGQESRIHRGQAFLLVAIPSPLHVTTLHRGCSCNASYSIASLRRGRDPISQTRKWRHREAE